MGDQINFTDNIFDRLTQKETTISGNKKKETNFTVCSKNAIELSIYTTDI